MTKKIGGFTLSLLMMSQLAWAAPGMVTSRSDEVKDPTSLRNMIETSYNAGKENVFSPKSSQIDYDYFEQAIYFMTKEVASEGVLPVEIIVLGHDPDNLSKKPVKNPILKFSNTAVNLVIGNIGSVAFNDAASDVNYSSADKELVSTSEHASRYEWGNVIIDAATNFEDGVVPFECGVGAKNVYFRHVTLLTRNANRQMLPSCIKSGGNFKVYPGIFEMACGDSHDNDNDGLEDCKDPDCAGVGKCPANPIEQCTNVADIDHDGKPDFCKEDACKSRDECKDKVEICGNDIDDDGKNGADCEDPACASHVSCAPTTEPVEICGNGIDDNANGLSDCADPEVAGSQGDPDCVDFCDANPSEVCDDFIDNDENTMTDCADDACKDTAFCRTIEAESVCNDAIDEDHDGAIDCADSDCDTNDLCVPESKCNDGEDNDKDGNADCNDVDCAESSACAPDNLDGDGDGIPFNEDCDDEDPKTYPGAIELCDGKDNDCRVETDMDYGCIGDLSVDDDGDGYCEADVCTDGSLPNDCDDSNPGTNPSAQEICGDNIDNDCIGGDVVDTSTSVALMKAQGLPPACVVEGISAGNNGSGSSGCGCDISASRTPSKGIILAWLMMALIPLVSLTWARKESRVS